MDTWGGRAWKRHVDSALAAMGDLTGKSVLELGFNDGTMAREFARRGATVTALEVRQAAVEKVSPCAGVTFAHYSGDLDSVGGQYDFVFTKSVLVLTDLPVMLAAIRRKLAPGGCAVFIENGAGLLPLRWLRYLLRPRSVWGNVHYFKRSDVRFIRSQFGSCDVRRSVLPPVYLMIAHRPISFAQAHRACAIQS